MNAPTPDPTLGSQAIPTSPCDVCGKEFAPGDVWNYHARLGVYVHTSCAADGPVRGEDITTHTVLWGQVPAEPGKSSGMPSPGSSREVTAAVECPLSERVDGKLHTWRFDGDDPYVRCHWCGEVQDALNGNVLVKGRRS